MVEQVPRKQPRHLCKKCGGLFLSKAHLVEAIGPRVTDTLEQYATGVVQTADGPVHQPVRKSLVHCPRDGASMVNLSFKRAELKLCPDCHSVWLPQAEFSKIVAAVVVPTWVVGHHVASSSEDSEGDRLEALDNALRLGDTDFGDWLTEFFDGLGEADW